MRIGIDLDDVLFDFHNPLREYHNAVYGTSLKPEDFTSYKFNEVWGGTLQDAINKVNDFHKSDYFKAVLFGDYPWNKNSTLPKSVIRTKNWKEILEKLK